MLSAVIPLYHAKIEMIFKDDATVVVKDTERPRHDYSRKYQTSPFYGHVVLFLLFRPSFGYKKRNPCVGSE